MKKPIKKPSERPCFEFTHPAEQVTLRDKIAMHTIGSIVSCWWGSALMRQIQTTGGEFNLFDESPVGFDPLSAAREAYKIADAMILARGDK